MYLAQDLRHHRPVAIKVMEVGSGTLSSRDRIRQEIELEARLVHPHIVPLFDSGEIGEDALYFVMPYLDGESLQQRLAREGPLPLADALQVARDVAEALAHAHQKQIVHRDIKPGNILFASGSALVADFGVARVMGSTTQASEATAHRSRTTRDVIVGTPAYMAPEHAAGDPALDGRADLYSLGCVLYEMLAGRPPFDARSPGGVAARHASDPVPPLRTVRPSVPEAVEALIERALAKSPADRFATASEMAVAIAEALGAAAPSTRRRRRANRRRYVGYAALATTLALGAVALFGKRQSSERRALAAADSALVVLFPFEGDSESNEGTTEQFRRALQRWGDLRLVDQFVVREAMRDGPLTMDRSRSLAAGMGAGRFIRARLTAVEGRQEITAVLVDVNASPSTLAERSERVETGGAARDSALVRLADGLLVRQPLPRDLVVGAAGTRSLTALQHYLRGREAVQNWSLDSAVSAFDLSSRSDPTFAAAHRWAALIRFWQREDASLWRLAAHAALRLSVDTAPPPHPSAHARGAAPATARASAYERSEARALVAFVEGDVARACETWDALTRSAVFRFEAWYSAATCRNHDQLVVPDPRSPSGWRFRSSYHTAINQYLQAFQLMPSIHAALRERSFERLRDVLFVSRNTLRWGLPADDGQVFVAQPTLEADTLVFVPYPAARVFASDPDVARAQLDRGGRVLRRQRELFRDIASSWVMADPRSIAAREAQALSLQLLGDRAALDTLARAVALAPTAALRHRLAGTEVWVRVRFAIPTDLAALRLARLLADSALADTTDQSDQRVRASLAALTGQAAAAFRIYTDRTQRVAGVIPAIAAQVAADLELWSAFGGPADSLRAIAWRLDSLISAHVPEESRATARAMAFRRAAWLAGPGSAIPAHLVRGAFGDIVTPALLAAAEHDTIGVRRATTRIRELRTIRPPSTITYDALLAETSLLAWQGDLTTAAAWLDEAFAAVRVGSPDFDPANAAAMVRAMALRAIVAEAAGDQSVAQRWAAAVVALWENADPSLAPLVDRMRALTR